MDPVATLIHVVEVLALALVGLAWRHLLSENKDRKEENKELKEDLKTHKAAVAAMQLQIANAGHPTRIEFNEVRDNVLTVKTMMDGLVATVKRWDETYFHNDTRGRRGSR